jgi:hypothetical protein
MGKTDQGGQAVPKGQGKSKLGLTSFILSVITILMLCMLLSVYYLLVYVTSRPLPDNVGDFAQLGNQFAVAASYLAFCPAIIGLLTALGAVVLGATSLARRENRKGLAIAGIVIGILTGLVMCAATLILTFMSRT